MNKGPSSQGYGFSSGHVFMWELDYKESWMPKNWCFWAVVLEKTLESPLNCKEIKLVNPKGNQPCIFIGRTDAEAEAPILWPPMQRVRHDWTDWLNPNANPTLIKDHNLPFPVNVGATPTLGRLTSLVGGSRFNLLKVLSLPSFMQK